MSGAKRKPVHLDSHHRSELLVHLSDDTIDAAGFASIEIPAVGISLPWHTPLGAVSSIQIRTDAAPGQWQWSRSQPLRIYQPPSPLVTAEQVQDTSVPIFFCDDSITALVIAQLGHVSFAAAGPGINPWRDAANLNKLHADLGAVPLDGRRVYIALEATTHAVCGDAEARLARLLEAAGADVRLLTVPSEKTGSLRQYLNSDERVLGAMVHDAIVTDVLTRAELVIAATDKTRAVRRLLKDNGYLAALALAEEVDLGAVAKTLRGETRRASIDAAINGFKMALAQSTNNPASTSPPTGSQSSAPSAGVQISGPERTYQRGPGSMVMLRMTPTGAIKDRSQLASFAAWISADLIIDDGAETRREYEIDGELPGTQRNATIALPTIRVAAAEFEGMAWCGPMWGPRVILPADINDRRRLRVAIQETSPSIVERRVYAQTGWREIDGRHVYLHGRGAVGAPNIDVELGSLLDGLWLPDLPADLPAVVEAVKESLRLQECGPGAFMLPLMAFTFAAPLRPMLGLDFAVWIVGTSGYMKSVRAALFQSHWGGHWTCKHLPSSWLSSWMAIALDAHTAADAVLVVDDYAPQATKRLEQEQAAGAVKLIRSIGNQQSRERCHSDGIRKRASRPPRAAVMFTGEKLPPGVQSLHARLFIVEASEPTAEHLAAITRAQVQTHLLPVAMRAYIEYVSERYDEMAARLPKRVIELRNELTQKGAHRRQPEQVAQLLAALEVWCEFARSIDAIDTAGKDTLIAEARMVMTESSQREAEELAELDVGTAYLSRMRSLLTQGRLKLGATTGFQNWLDDEYAKAEQEKRRPAISGRDKFGMSGQLIVGWRDRDFAYLHPDDSISALREYGQRDGGHWAHSKRDVLAALEGQRIIQRNKGGRPTARVWAEDVQQCGWKIPIDLLVDLDPEQLIDPTTGQLVAPNEDA